MQIDQSCRIGEDRRSESESESANGTSNKNSDKNSDKNSSGDHKSSLSNQNRVGDQKLRLIETIRNQFEKSNRSTNCKSINRAESLARRRCCRECRKSADCSRTVFVLITSSKMRANQPVQTIFLLRCCRSYRIQWRSNGGQHHFPAGPVGGDGTAMLPIVPDPMAIQWRPTPFSCRIGPPR